jgi:exopolysaccharide production protein ExoQ
MGLVALTLALVFAATLIVRDCRRRPSVSSAVWIPTVLVMVLGSRSVSQWLHGGHGYYQELGNQAATDPIDLIFSVVVIAASLVITIRRGINWGRVFAANAALMLLYSYFVFSISWSGDPMGSFKRIVKDFGMLFVIGVIFSEKEPLQAMRAVYLRSASLMLPLSLVFIRWFPSYGRVYALNGSMTATGVTTQKNTLGEMALIYVLFLVWDYLEARKQSKGSLWRRVPWDQVILVLMSLWLLRVSESKTSFLCLVIGVFLMIRWKSMASTALNIGVFWGALMSPLLLFFSQQFSSVIAPLVEALGRNMTFTGRANIWEHITLDTVNPLIGCGYYNFWGGPGGYAISTAMDTTVPNAHNGYLDLYLDGGFIGLVILSILLIASGRRLIRRLAKQAGTNYYARMCFAVLIVAIVSNLSESTFARVSLIWFTTLLMIVGFPGKRSVRMARINTARGADNSLEREPRILASR